MKVGYPSILCGLVSANIKNIGTVLFECDLTFAQNEFDFVELAGERRFDLILTSCQRGDERYASACRIIRLFDDLTPLLFITGPSGLTEQEAGAVGVEIVRGDNEQSSAEDLTRRIHELL